MNDAMKTAPRALCEVWAWKDAAAAEVRGLTTAEAIQAIHHQAAAICKKYGIPQAIIRKTSLRVAEGRDGYGKRTKAKRR